MQSQFLKQPLLILSVAMMSVFFVSCAHKLSPVQFPTTASPSEEIEKLANSLDVSAENQVDVLAPRPFQQAQSYYKKAVSQNDRGKDPNRVLESLGYSRAYLNLARSEAIEAENQLEGIASARRAALIAGSKGTSKDLFENLSKKIKKLDREFMKLTKNFDSLQNIRPEKKVDLQDKYLNLELQSIKNKHLKKTKDLLRSMRNKGAEDFTPTAYKEAVQDFNMAEKIIETDRYNLPKIKTASKMASLSAKRVANLLETAKASKNQTPEERAMLLESREMELREAEARAAEKEMKLKDRDSELSQKSTRLSLVEASNQDLEQKAKEEEQVLEAAAKFSKDEADVYSQDGHLVVRLKKVNFASGRADLPSQSLPLLAKVKEVIQELRSKHVRVEGHTDSTGSAETNQALSEKRAAIVAKHFVVDKIISEDQVEFVGHGFSKPLATNKTKEGREQNRRVDIFIKTD